MNPSELTPANIPGFAGRWLVAYGLAVVAATLVLAGFEAWREFSAPETTGFLDLGHLSARAFWRMVYLGPQVAGFGLTFGLGFSFFPELRGIHPRRWRYVVFGALAGIILLLLGSPDAINEGLAFPTAGAVAGFVLASLRLGRPGRSPGD